MTPDGANGETSEALVGRLYEESRNNVYYYLLTLGLGPAQAQEAAQEVFLRLYATLRKGEAVLKPRAWIFRVAHNLGLKLRAREGQETPFEADAGERVASSRPDPESELLERERTMRLKDAMGSLSEQQRRCLYLRLEGLKYPEIGSALGISASAVGEFLRRAMARLRKGVE
jgi:RNA polymerase sigma-70 factor, ECF subfamily